MATHSPARRFVLIASLLVVVVVVAGFTGPGLARADSVMEFKAHFHDFDVCDPGIHECGKGVVKGYGVARTTLVFTTFVPGPEGCVTGTADRRVWLDDGTGALVLSIMGTICGNKIEGTFAIAAGSGVFAGASGEGTISGVAIPGVPGDTVHLRGKMTLP